MHYVSKCINRCVFSLFLKMLTLSDGSRRSSGSVFQATGPATENARRPSERFWTVVDWWSSALVLCMWWMLPLLLLLLLLMMMMSDCIVCFCTGGKGIWGSSVAVYELHECCIYCSEAWCCYRCLHIGQWIWATAAGKINQLHPSTFVNFILFVIYDSINSSFL